MVEGGAPDAWFWSHDIGPDQVDSVATAGTRLVRLSSYGDGERRRFAALVYLGGGPERGYALDLEAEPLRARLREEPSRPVAITVADGEPPRFSVVFDHEPGLPSHVHLDLDEAGLHALLDGHRRVLDLATYTGGGVRRFAVILADGGGGSWLVTGVEPDDLDARLRELDAGADLLREYRENGRRVLAAVAARPRPDGQAWYAGLDADGVAAALEDNRSYPVDIDATRDERGVRFTVVMRRER